MGLELGSKFHHLPCLPLIRVEQHSSAKVPPMATHVSSFSSHILSLPLKSVCHSSLPPYSAPHPLSCQAQGLCQMTFNTPTLWPHFSRQVLPPTPSTLNYFPLSPLLQQDTSTCSPAQPCHSHSWLPCSHISLHLALPLCFSWLGQVLSCSHQHWIFLGHLQLFPRAVSWVDLFLERSHVSSLLSPFTSA